MQHHPPGLRAHLGRHQRVHRHRHVHVLFLVRELGQLAFDLPVYGDGHDLHREVRWVPDFAVSGIGGRHPGPLPGRMVAR